MKITKRQLRRIIKEEVKRKISESADGMPTGRLRVEWDFQTDDPEWNAIPYEQKLELEGIPEVIQVSPDIMDEYMMISSEESSAEADYMITDWLSDEFGWLSLSWYWDDEQSGTHTSRQASVDAFLDAVPSAERV